MELETSTQRKRDICKGLLTSMGTRDVFLGKERSKSLAHSPVSRPWHTVSAHSLKHGKTPRKGSLVSVHGGTLGAATELPLRRRADGPAATRVTTSSAALLQSQKLLGAESLVVDLASGFHQILQMGAGQKVAQINELAVVLVLDIDHTPAVLATAYLLAIDDDGLLTTDNREWDNILLQLSEVY